MSGDLTGTNVLITGGTRGIGLACGLALAKLGARVALTNRWGSVTEEELAAQFEAAGATRPDLFEADVAHDDDTTALMESLKERGYDKIDVFVSNVAFAQIVKELDEMNRRGLLRGIDYTAWPLVGYSMAIHKAFGKWPSRIIGMSSYGHVDYHCNYDFAASAKAVLETLVKYLGYRLFDEGVRVNAIRARWVETESLEATVGKDFPPFVRQWPHPGQFVTPDEVAGGVVALCSGWLDGMNGTIIGMDHGASFFDNVMRLYTEEQQP